MYACRPKRMTEIFNVNLESLSQCLDNPDS